MFLPWLSNMFSLRIYVDFGQMGKSQLPYLLPCVLTLASLDGSDFSALLGKDWFIVEFQITWKTGRVRLMIVSRRVSNLKHAENVESAVGLSDL